MRTLARVIGLAIASAGLGPSVAHAQQTTPGIVVLPAPGTVAPPDSEMKRAYLIEKGMPYSGVRVVHHVMIDPNGDRKEETHSTKEWRDSEGRTRKDFTWKLPDGNDMTVCEIDDMVGLLRYIWKVGPTAKTVVTETHYKMDGVISEVWPGPPHKIEPEPGRTIVILTPHQERKTNANDGTLGPKYINGLYATGTRTVEAIPPGRGGNETDHPVYRVDEVWDAPDLNTVVKMFFDTGLGFTERSELKNIDRSEPDPALFRPPDGLPKREAPESDPVWSEPIGVPNALWN